MPTRPRLKTGRHMLPGLAAVALFVVMAAVFVSAALGAPAGFDSEVANVSVADTANASVDVIQEDGRTVANVTAANESRQVTVVNSTGVETSVFRGGGGTRVVATVGVTRSIGIAMFDLDSPAIESDGFLAAFEIIDIVLVAALVGAVMLARREEGGSLRTALTDGGRRLVGSDDEGGED